MRFSFPVRSPLPAASALFLAAAAFVLASGCAAPRQFVYKPGPPVAGAPRVPAKVAVLAFEDGTEDFTQRGSILRRGQINLAKVRIRGTMTAMTPELWAKWFADDLAASGSFGSAVFRYSASELVNEEYFIEGVVMKAYAGISREDLNEFDLAFKGVRKADGKLVWKKRVATAWMHDPNLTRECGSNVNCAVEKAYAFTNAKMQALFAEARADLVRTLGARPANGDSADAFGAGLPGVGDEAGANPATPGSGESAEQTIDRILKAQ